MADSKHLREECVRMRQAIQTKTNDANKAIINAMSFIRIGNLEKANRESELANKRYREVIELERVALDLDHKAMELENRAFMLEKQQNELASNIHAQLDVLERQRRTLQGNY